ncbi:MAG: hypothetical protein NC080_07525 [Paraprevotella sp.]|nr:hypothetical protein [Paraprevotella sp.]
MSIVLANGRVVPGMFDKIHDKETDTTFSPLRGTGSRMTLKADGPAVEGDGLVQLGGGQYRVTEADKLRYKAMMQGVIRPRIDAVEFLEIPHRPRKK